MTVIVTVIDMRCGLGMGTRSKAVETVEEAVKWARHFKRLRSNSLTLIQDGKAQNLPIYTTAAWQRKYGKRDHNNGWS